MPIPSLQTTDETTGVDTRYDQCMGERWADLPDWHEYRVSDQGRVWKDAWELEVPHLRRTNHYKPFYPKLTFDPYSGYYVVGLTTYRDDERFHQRFAIHQLVMQAFVGPLPPGMVTRHLNGVSTDNRLANLTYGTPSENMFDKVEHGHDPNTNKDRCPRAHLYADRNLFMSDTGSRQCRACRSGYRNANRHGRRMDYAYIQRLADHWYAKYMPQDIAWASGEVRLDPEWQPFTLARRAEYLEQK